MLWVWLWLPYVLLSLAIVALWFPAAAPARGVPGRGERLERLAIPGALLVLAIGAGLIGGVVSAVAAGAAVAFGGLCYGFYAVPAPAGVRVVLGLAVIVFSLALMAHVVPGFSNLLIVRQALFSEDGVPYTLYLNFDKALIGLFLIGFGTVGHGPRLNASLAEWKTMLAVMLPRVVVVILVVMASALAMGHVRVDLKWPAVLPIWTWSNLLFTCTAEEAAFRGLIQRTLTDRWPPLAGVAIAAVLFGVVHYAGGVRAIVLARIAGLGYGWIFWRTGRIESSILTHFLLNATHILAFTYPARHP